MSKKQRIEDLERRVQDLERRLVAQEARQPSVFYPLPPQPSWVPSAPVYPGPTYDRVIVTAGGIVSASDGLCWN